MEEDKAGGVWSFGWNVNGQLGQSISIQSQKSPRYVAELEGIDIIDISSSDQHTLFLTANNEVYSVGSGSYGKLGHGNKADLDTPKKIETLQQPIISVCAGPDHSICLSQTGEVWVFGSGYSGRIGTDDNKSTSSPKTMCGLRQVNVIAVTCGGANSMLLSDKYEVWTIGHNDYGQCGIGKASSEARYDSEIPKMNIRVENGVLKKFEVRPQRVTALSGIKIIKMSCGGRHMAALSDTSDLYTWGNNEHGQLGVGDRNDRDLPTQVYLDYVHWKNKTNGSGSCAIVDISMGTSHSAIVTDDGKLFTWGQSFYGKLGYANYKYHGTTKSVYVKGPPQEIPKFVEALTGVKIIKVSCGQHHTAALSIDKQLFAFGWDKYGQLGLGERNPDEIVQAEDANPGDIFSLPIEVPTIRNVSKFACGSYHTFCLISGNRDLALQFSLDGDNSRLQAVMSNLDQSSISSLADPLNGFTPLHWAAFMNYPNLVIALNKYKFIIKDSLGRSPLHISAERGLFECTKNFIENYKYMIDETDSEENTCLHLALKNKHMQVAEEIIKANPNLFDAKNSDSKIPIDFLSFEESFIFKVISKRHDVVIYSTADDHAFASEIFQSAEKFLIKCYSPAKGTPKQEIQEKIQASKGVVFVISKAFAADPASVSILQYCKEQSKKAFPLWKEKFTFDPLMESLLYRTQLVDFSEYSKFNENMSSLVAGLRKLFVSQEESSRFGDIDSVDSPDQVGDGKNTKETHNIFIASDPLDASQAEELQKKLVASGFTCLMSKNVGVSQLSQMVVSCGYLIYLISKKSIESSKLRDLVALAENHNRKIFPVFVDQGLKLDAAMEYTLASTPKYFLKSQSEYYLNHLIYAIKTNELVKQMSEDAKQLDEEWKPLKKRLDKRKNEKTTKYFVQMSE